jgi:hypothetical protein
MGGEDTTWRGRRGDYNNHGQLILREAASQNKISGASPLNSLNLNIKQENKYLVFVSDHLARAENG